jgi:hypothetical protein
MVAAFALLCSSAFAWGPLTHDTMALNVVYSPNVLPLLQLYGLDPDDIASMAWELDLPEYRDTYHGGWSVIVNREWLTDPKWANLDEPRRIAFLIHIACDAGVPLCHSPANTVFCNKTVEALLEARCDTWTTSPGITPYTGTYADKMNAFYAQEIALANWCKSNLKWYNVSTGSQGRTAGWSGITYGQNLCEAMLVEYLAP